MFKHCGHCGKQLFIMWTVKNRVLPVEVEPGRQYNSTDLYDKEVHKSHLLNCVPLQQNWLVTSNKLIKKMTSALALSPKDLCR